jgi:hypothetical protein
MLAQPEDYFVSPRGWRLPWIPYLKSNGRDRQAAVPSSQSSTVARNVTRDGRLEGPPAVASWRHSVGRLVTLLPLASPYAVVGQRISGDYEEALLLPAKPGKGEFRLKKADRAGDAVDSPGVI